MSFGKPPNFSNFAVTAPDRGSFPLDHDGECKQFMTAYLKCLKSNKGENGKCRHLTKEYLQCRMDNGLMEKDEWENLGLQGVDVTMSPEVAERARAKAHAQSQAQQPQSQGLPQQEAKR